MAALSWLQKANAARSTARRRRQIKEMEAGRKRDFRAIAAMGPEGEKSSFARATRGMGNRGEVCLVPKNPHVQPDLHLTHALLVKCPYLQYLLGGGPIFTTL